MDCADEVTPTTQGLRANNLSAWEAIGQSLAMLAPTAGPAVILPLALLISGNGTWLVFVIATIATICIAYEINTFARRSSSPGSLYTYVGQELPSASVTTAWALLLAYIGTGSGAACSLGLYLYALLVPHGVITRFIALGLALLAVAAASLFAWFDVKISTRLMLGMKHSPSGSSSFSLRCRDTAPSCTWTAPSSFCPASPQSRSVAA